MKAKNLNASSVKTRNLIRDTFAELLYEKKNINKITVTELVQRADINRSTFYSHYDDVRHVAEDIKAETLKAFFENKTISNVWFLNNNGILYRPDGSKRIADNTLVALTLMIAESRTEEKDVMVKVVVNLINQRNE